MNRLRNRNPVTQSRRRYLRSLNQRKDRAVLVVCTIGWAISLAVFWIWWFQGSHWRTPFGMYLSSIAVSLNAVAPAWVFFSVRAAAVPVPGDEMSELRVALIVTKAPSEPWETVCATLRGILRQEYPHPYDVWLADESSDEETRAWCHGNGVRISTREGRPDYHREVWPRRTKCKEGNLAFFYDHWGYRDYDVVCQFDADHTPAPGYLTQILAGFSDPAVGYVAAPSICDVNAKQSWAARGRLHREAVLHGPLQAGHNMGLAPSCIGSHYAVRTQALAEIGGVGPELAEDYTTSFLLNAAGWEGAFAIDALAHGEGPESFPDAMTQEFQWSRSLATVYLTVAPSHWRTIPVRARAKLGFTLVWYPLFVVQMLFGFLFGQLALVSGTSLVRVSLSTYLIRASTPTLFVIAAIFYLRSRGWLRPSDVPIFSWEGNLFHIARWPWVAIGVVHAVIGWATGRVLSFRVTPKAGAGDKDLPVKAIAPYVLLSIWSAAVIVLINDGGDASGYYIFAMFNAALYAIVAMAVVMLHRIENPTMVERVGLRSQVGLATLAALVSVAVFLYRFDQIASALRYSGLVPGSGPGVLNVWEAIHQPFVIAYVIVATCLLVWIRWCNNNRAPRPYDSLVTERFELEHFDDVVVEVPVIELREIPASRSAPIPPQPIESPPVSSNVSEHV